MPRITARAKGALEVAKIRQRELRAQGREDEARDMDFHIADLMALANSGQGSSN